MSLAQLVQQYMEKWRIATHLAQSGSGTNPEESQKLPCDLTHICGSARPWSVCNLVLQKDLEIHIRGESLKQDDLSRYLGISLDPQLCLRCHIKEVADSMQERTTILQKLVGTNWGC
ncbi:RNA-directed DNA polymerase from mobile element jockey-like [Plakobranchus ocellatus]|uniref:RNA-directed DNA polymerase from mobile element jockey-like n=1 Tax=Plakobranchus ocellatus TaxID=259542 RepID=A0AAV4BZ82_9GAST|nr:RNA-directed DNA polymerase from mobile element jockey-like [Plakobranchus ocellatus]